MITSELQKAYNLNNPKGGYSYYTLYRGESTDTKPSYAQTGDVFEEYGTGKVYTCVRTNGKAAWTEDPNAKRQTETGGGGGSLPADFPTEGSANANKFLGFDANGDYAAKDAPSGGGAEKFIVTLIQENDTWTADKTIAEIAAAYEAKQVVVAQYVSNGFTIELPINTGVSMQGVAGAVFIGFENSGNDNKNVTVLCSNEGSGDNIQVTKNTIPTSSNAPLIVTLTESSGTLTGDKTYQEVKEARLAGRPVDLVMGSATCSSVLDVSSGESSISVSFIASGQLMTATGAPSDYVSKTLG